MIGSGASGGWAAKRLCEAGLKVAVVDAGRRHTPADFREHKPDFELKYRNRAPEVIKRTRPRQSECYACTEHNFDWFANDLEEPYTTPAEKPFSWQGRMRIMGGRTNVWARQSYRFSDLDFKAASTDGHGIGLAAGICRLAPYYDLVERYVGISGLAEGVYELPDGQVPAADAASPARRCVCATAAKEKFGRTVTIGRAANLTTTAQRASSPATTAARASAAA